MAKKKFLFTKGEISVDIPSRINTQVDWEPPTNIIDAGETAIIEVELPGVEKEDVSIVLENDNTVIIRGVKPQPRVNEASRITYQMFEREFGSFSRRIVIDFPLDASKINSVMKNGVLTVKIPRKKNGPISVEIK